jgi:hypothetical protein
MHQQENEKRALTKAELELLWNYMPEAKVELTPYNHFCMHWFWWFPQVILTPDQETLVNQFIRNKEQHKDLTRVEIEKYFGYVRPESLTDEVHDALDWKWWSYVIVTVPGLRALAARLAKERSQESFKFKRRSKTANVEQHVVVITPEIKASLESIHEKLLKEKEDRNQ